ncbi:MAG: HEPN domain-containing protein [Geobacteraceae bacterium]|nr:HEPN domain-containing protein [Geobacteraceae bacterium]
MNKKSYSEIFTISNSPKRRPYASKISIALPEGLEYRFDGETTLLLDAPYIVRIKPIIQKEGGKNPQKLTAIAEGFATACEAEQVGLKLSLAIMWSAVSRKWPIKLDYHTPQPCMIFDRTHTGGLGMSISASIIIGSSAHQVSNLINDVLSRDITIDNKLLVSMELFTSARLESTERAKFIGLVSSLEPLAAVKKYNIKEIDDLICSFIHDLNELVAIPENTRKSIESRANALKAESISQAIARLVSEYFDEDTEAVNIVKEAYNIRSKILHEGSFDADLDEKSNKLEDVIRHIYSRILDLPLLSPATIPKKI